MNRNKIIVLSGLLLSLSCRVGAGDWPMWGGQPGRNMVSAETGLPDTFAPGDKNPQTGLIDPATTRNVKWTAKLGSMTVTTPAVAGGRVFIGGCEDSRGFLECLDEATGRVLWRWSAPIRTGVPKEIDGRKFWFNVFPKTLGVCSSPAVDGERVYIVDHRCNVICFDVKGGEKPAAAGSSTKPVYPDGKILWTFDLWEHGIRPSDAMNCSPVVEGELLYLCTGNGVDRDADARKKDELRKPPAPDAPSLIALDKRTGKLAAQDQAGIGPRLLHGQWSSPSVGVAGGKKLIVLGGGDGACYAFEALAAVPAAPVKLQTAWTFNCVPPEYKAFGGLDPIAHYSRGDKRRSDTLNKVQDGQFAGTSEIIATPVFHEGRVYVAIGRDPAHGRGRGALWCIDASGRGDITKSGRIWCYQGLDRAIATVSVAGGLVYVSDVAGRLHCVDANTGKPCWVYEANSQTWGSTLVADGKVYMPTEKYLNILAAGRDMKLLGRISLGAPIWASPMAANGSLYVASTKYLWACSAKP